jgi:hypothetical protein
LPDAVESPVDELVAIDGFGGSGGRVEAATRGGCGFGEETRGVRGFLNLHKNAMGLSGEKQEGEDSAEVTPEASYN